MMSLYSRDDVAISLPVRDRHGRFELALAWSLAALLVLGLAWIGFTAGDMIHQMPDQVSAMWGFNPEALP